MLARWVRRKGDVRALVVCEGEPKMWPPSWTQGLGRFGDPFGSPEMSPISAERGGLRNPTLRGLASKSRGPLFSPPLSSEKLGLLPPRGVGR